MTMRVASLVVLVLAVLQVQQPYAMAQDTTAKTSARATSPAASQPLSATDAPPFPRMNRLPLAVAMKVPIGGEEFSLDDVARRWPFFHHRPFNEAGFNALSLPFRFDAQTDGADPNEAQAFAFLLSNALDWAPGCYCARHAYFVFKRNREEMEPLRNDYDGYDPAVVRRLIKQWTATHAIGGMLTKEPGGYCGELEIYDPNGVAVLTTPYKEPRDFCVLVGDMAADAMRFFGDKPSPSLVQHLRRKRCQDPNLLAELGAAAFEGERTPEEFGIYDDILSREPNFAEVRYWWANQRRWADDDLKRYAEQEAIALQTCPIPSVLHDFNPRGHRDSNDAAKVFKRSFEQAKELVGEDHPLIIRLELENWPKEITGPQFERATAVAERYPNDYWLLVHLAWEYIQRRDHTMAASIFAAAARCPYMTGNGSRWHAMHGLAYCIGQMGQLGASAHLLQTLAQEDLANDNKGCLAMDYGMLGTDLSDMCQYDEAIEPSRQGFRLKANDEGWDAFVLIRGGVAAAYAGRIDICNQILRDHKDVLDAHGQTFLLEAYRQAAADGNNPPNADDVEKSSRSTEDWQFIREKVFFAELDLMAGQDKHRAKTTQMLAQEFDCRAEWMVFDLYDRRQTRPESASFYETLDWLHSDDPWARQAVADFRSRCPNPKMLTADELLARMKDYQPERWPTTQPDRRKAALAIADSIPPGAVPAAIRGLIQKGEFDKAVELALRYHHLVLETDRRLLGSHASWLVHLAKDAKGGFPPPAVGAPAAQPSPSVPSTPPPSPPPARRRPAEEL